jgi:hypothetical protein
MMKTSTPFQYFNITRAGTIARACLASGHRGSVLAAFSRAIYLQSEAGELFWITALDEPMHRRCAQMSSPLPVLSSGSQYHVDGQSLIIDRVILCDLGQASEWSEPCADPVVDAASLWPRIHNFFTDLDYTQARGFGTFIPSILSIYQGAPGDLLPELTDPILIYARPLVMDMAHACLECQPSFIYQHADTFIGLGMGLTPSGDDFLGGALFALKSIYLSVPDIDFTDDKPCLEANRSRTNRISFTLLNDLADGHAIAPLHHIINGLITGEASDRIFPFISRLTRVGHSTGWDLLTGLLAGLLMTNRSHFFIPSFQVTKSLVI